MEIVKSVSEEIESLTEKINSQSEKINSQSEKINSQSEKIEDLRHQIISQQQKFSERLDSIQTTLWKKGKYLPYLISNAKMV